MLEPKLKSDYYISADIEADGPIPGPYSMLAFGLTVAGRFDGQRFDAADPEAATFYRELRPISDDFDPKALEVAGLDRERLASEGANPEAAMAEAAEWVGEQVGGARPVLVGYPVVFDWMFLHWYFIRFAGESPFGFSGALDIKTIYQQKAGVTISEAGRADLPPELRSSREHTHNALDDAVEQAEIFARLFTWSGGEKSSS
jgi:DNA polymerase III epsilon subunit-like protein